MKINTVDTFIEEFRNGREIFSRHSIELAVREILRLRTQLKSKEIVIESKQEEINKLAEKLLGWSDKNERTEQTFQCRDCKHKFVSNVPFNYYVCEKCGGSAFPIDLDCEQDICPNCNGAGVCAGDYFSEDGMTTCNRCNGTGIL